MFFGRITEGLPSHLLHLPQCSYGLGFAPKWIEARGNHNAAFSVL